MTDNILRWIVNGISVHLIEINTGTISWIYESELFIHMIIINLGKLCFRLCIRRGGIFFRRYWPTIYNFGPTSSLVYYNARPTYQIILPWFKIYQDLQSIKTLDILRVLIFKPLIYTDPWYIRIFRVQLRFLSLDIFLKLSEKRVSGDIDQP